MCGAHENVGAKTLDILSLVMREKLSPMLMIHVDDGDDDQD